MESSNRYVTQFATTSTARRVHKSSHWNSRGLGTMERYMQPVRYDLRMFSQCKCHHDTCHPNKYECSPFDPLALKWQLCASKHILLLEAVRDITTPAARNQVGYIHWISDSKHHLVSNVSESNGMVVNMPHTGAPRNPWKHLVAVVTVSVGLCIDFLQKMLAKSPPAHFLRVNHLFYSLYFLVTLANVNYQNLITYFITMQFGHVNWSSHAVVSPQRPSAVL